MNIRKAERQFASLLAFFVAGETAFSTFAVAQNSAACLQRTPFFISPLVRNGDLSIQSESLDRIATVNGPTLSHDQCSTNIESQMSEISAQSFDSGKSADSLGFFNISLPMPSPEVLNLADQVENQVDLIRTVTTQLVKPKSITRTSIRQPLPQQSQEESSVSESCDTPENNFAPSQKFDVPNQSPKEPANQINTSSNPIINEIEQTTPDGPPPIEVKPSEPKQESRQESVIGKDRTIQAGVPAAKPVSLGQLSILIRADPTASAFELEDKINNFAIPGALNREVIDATLPKAKVREVDETVYQALEALIRRGEFQPVAKSKGVQISEYRESAESGNSDWKIDIGRSELKLKELSLTFRDRVGRESQKLFTPEPKVNILAPLRFEGAGTYRLRVPSGTMPVRCELVMIDEISQTEIKNSIIWPRPDKYLLVVIDGFQSNPSLLLEQFQKPEVVGNQFKVEKSFVPISLSSADMRLEGGEVVGGEWLPDFTFEISLPVPDRTEPKRAWIEFPLRKEQRDSEIEQMIKVLEQEKYIGIPKFIRRNAIAANVDANLGPDLKAKWFELPFDTLTKQFRRRIKLTDIDGWKNLTTLDECFGLVVYEFGDEDLPRPVQIINPSTKEPVYFVDREFPEFISGLPKKPTPNEAKPDEAKPEANERQ